MHSNNLFINLEILRRARANTYAILFRSIDAKYRYSKKVWIPKVLSIEGKVLILTHYRLCHSITSYATNKVFPKNRFFIF